MDNAITGRLPAPHDCIEVEVSHWIGDSWHVRYTGTPKQLIAAGIVDDDMVRKIRSQKGGARVGKDGYEFKLESGRLPAHRAWELDEPIALRKKVRRKRNVELPAGMRDLFPNGLPSQEERDRAIRENPGPVDRVCGSLSVQACAYAEAVGRVVSRSRAVGRSRRLMRWSTINGTVIAPDWAWLAQARLTGGAS